MATKKFNRYKKINENRNTKNGKLRNILKTKQKRGRVILKNKKLTSKHSNFTNKYDKTGKSHKYIKMPEIDTSIIQPEHFLPPLKYIETDKQSIDTEKMVVEKMNFYDKIEKKEKLNPKTDFYMFINHAWMKEQQIKMQYKKYYFVKLDSFRFVQDKVNLRVVNLATEYYKNNNTSLSKKVENVMTSMKFSNLTFDKIKPHIDDMITQHAKYVKSDDLVGYLAFINRNEIVSWGCPISWSIYQDEKDAVNTRSYISSPRLSFYDFDLYITPHANKKYTSEFRMEFNLKFCEFVEKVFDKMLGKGHGLKADDVLKCEIEMLNAIMCFEPNKTSADFYNVVPTNESVKDCNFDWEKFAKGLGYKEVPKSYITPNKSFVKCIMTKLQAEWKTEKWKAYWYYMYLRQFIMYYKDAKILRFQFFKNFVTGQQGVIPEKIFPIYALSYCFNTLISRLYVANYVKQQSVYIADTLGNDLRKVFIRIINENSWLHYETKEQAIHKLETISIETIYPKYMIEDFDVTYPQGDAYGIMLAQAYAMCDYYITREGKHYTDVTSIDFSVNSGPSLNGTQPYVVNAFYNPTKNNIYVPAAILQEPFITLKAKGLEYNLAHIGYTFGHELSHCLDNTGRLFDYKGNKINWWTTGDEEKFNKKVKDVIKQYELFASWDGINMDASGMVGESMADISGLEICTTYLNMYLNETGAIEKVKEASFEEFFIYIAYQWREAIYKQAVRFNIKTNPHPLVKYRTNCPLARLKIYKKLYNIKTSDRMYWKNDTIWSNDDSR
jgi:putative endopeptidase